MAVASILEVGRLDPGFVLAPERYDPRRTSLASSDVLLGQLVGFSTEVASPAKESQFRHFLVLDTGDASEGIIRTRRAPCALAEIGSAKKRLRIGDVIISRLRPYLRQIAFVDAGLVADGGNAELICSTEFIVLRPRDEQSIAFLVPFLLSEKVQYALAAAQEGGHHPRLSQRSLEVLPVATELVNDRTQLSDRMVNAVTAARSAIREVSALVREAGAAREP